MSFLSETEWELSKPRRQAEARARKIGCAVVLGAICAFVVLIAVAVAIGINLA